MATVHTPVLLQEVIESLHIKKGGRYIDATLGGTGHTQEIVKRGGFVLALDQDRDAIERAKRVLQAYKQVQLVQGNFRDLKYVAQEYKFDNVSGILFDLGLSSDQIAGNRGFSFLHNDPLDMRMNLKESLTAEEILNTWTQEELEHVFAKFGEEEYASKIAEEVLKVRSFKKFETTKDLVQVIESVKPRVGKIHPATKVFMALRIAVNQELSSLRSALSDAIELLESTGRILVISFHSLEDRIVKQTFQKYQDENLGKIITKKPIIATENETHKNVRARSAKLRVFEKI